MTKIGSEIMTYIEVNKKNINSGNEKIYNETDDIKKKWRKVRLDEVIEVNPKETLRKNIMAKYIEMSNLDCFARQIKKFEIRAYKSGTKFKNGDTLLARISPCLEKGKTSLVDCLDNELEVGFGSTEYIVMRAKKGLMNEKYLYYMAISYSFRELAIKSMNGSSNRQRVQKNLLFSQIIDLPPLETQEKISSILSSLDDKIEINNEINKSLKDIAKTLFKSWFIDFEFPNEEGKPYKSSGGKFVESELGLIPEGWRIIKLDENIKLIKGKTPKKITNFKTEETPLKYLTIKTLKGDEVIYCSEENIVITEEMDILIVMDGVSSGTSYLAENGVLSTTFSKIEVKNNIDKMILFMYFKYYEDKIKEYNTGSAILHTDKRYIKRLKWLFPPKSLEKIFSSCMLEIVEIEKQTQKLKNIRKTLLQKLINGEIEI